MQVQLRRSIKPRIKIEAPGQRKPKHPLIKLPKRPKRRRKDRRRRR
jgi:hypothetical protein